MEKEQKGTEGEREKQIFWDHGLRIFKIYYASVVEVHTVFKPII